MILQLHPEIAYLINSEKERHWNPPENHDFEACYYDFGDEPIYPKTIHEILERHLLPSKKYVEENG